MENIDINTHLFKANERGERYLQFITVACMPLIVLFIYLIISFYPSTLTFKHIGIIALFICFLCIMILTLVSAWIAYSYALDTQVQIDPIRRHFVYTHNGKTIEFETDDVQAWYDTIGFKIGLGKMTRLTDHDSVLVLKSGQIIYLHAWLWEGDHSWLHAGGTWEHNIKFYLEAHHEQLHLPPCKTAWTYKYMFCPLSGN